MILTIMDSINGYLDSTGMNDSFSTTFIVVLVMIFISIMAYKAGARSVSLIFINSVLIIIGTLIGFVPVWVILGIILVVLLYAIMVINDIAIGSGG